MTRLNQYCPRCRSIATGGTSICLTCYQPLPAAQVAEPAVAGLRAALTGRVIEVNPIRSEPRDFSWWRLFWKALLWMVVGVAAALYFVLHLILRAFFPRFAGRCGWTWLLFLRGNSQPTEQLLQFSVHGDDGGERLAEVKGRILQGAVQVGHRVALWGRWHGGTLRVDYGFNLSTRSWFGAK